MTAQGRARIRALLAKHDISPRKRWGQHFLADPNMVDKIVRFSRVGPGDRVVEVGAGTGALTIALAATGAEVVTFEIDSAMEPLLHEVLAGTDVDVRFGDVAAMDLASVLREGSWTMVANLPYNVGTGLVLDSLRSSAQILRYVVMLQREVAERLTAAPGSAAYGLPSVTAQLYGEPEFGFLVPAAVFVPAPDVESAVVEIRRRPTIPVAAPEAERLAEAAFNQRRKMLRGSLSAVLDDPEDVLRSAGIDPASRPEQLGAEDFLLLAAEMRAAR